MAIEPDDILLDALYEELDPDAEEAKSLSPELATELEGWREFRESLGEQFHVHTPNPSVRAAVMAAARDELAKQVEIQATDDSPRRPPGVDKRGFWAKLASGQGAQIGLVATILLVGAFSLRYMNLDSPQMSMEPAFEEAGIPMGKDEVAAAAPAFDAPEEAAPAMAEAEEEVAERFAAPVEGQEARAAEPTPEPEMKKDSALLAREETGRSDAKPEPQRRIAAKRPTKVAPSTRSAGPAEEPSKKAAPKSKFYDFDDSLVKAESMGNRAAAPSSAEPAEAAPMPAPVESKMDEAMEFSVKEKGKAESAPGGTIDAVEAAFRSRDWRRVISESQTVATSSAPAVQKARALELRAQAYRQMGMFQQALETYRNIETNFPTYQTDRIRSSRVEIEQELESRPQPSSRQKRSYDFESETLDELQ